MAHDDASDNTDLHTTPQNLYWHSYWLWELESSFRRLGPEYECFSMPYWDVTHDGEYWDETENPNIDDLPIYNSNLGGNGNIDNDYCVEQDPWTVKDYTTTYLCADDEETPDCCLKRYHDDQFENFVTRSEIADLVFVDPQYDVYHGFTKAMNTYHSNIHMFIGSVKHHTHFNPDKGEPEVDPIFPLFHTFIDYIRLMRADCYEFDTVAADDLDETIPFGYSQSENQTLDYPMMFSALCDNSDDEGARMCSYRDITPRLLYDLSPNGVFGVTYELGEFWHKNDALRGMCADYLNLTWWSDSETDTDSDVDEQFVADRVLHSESGVTSKTNIGVMVLMLSGIVVVALLRACGVAMSQKEVDLLWSGEGKHYGTV